MQSPLVTLATPCVVGVRCGLASVITSQSPPIWRQNSCSLASCGLMDASASMDDVDADLTITDQQRFPRQQETKPSRNLFCSKCHKKQWKQQSVGGVYAWWLHNARFCTACKDYLNCKNKDCMLPHCIMMFSQ